MPLLRTKLGVSQSGHFPKRTKGSGKLQLIYSIINPMTVCKVLLIYNFDVVYVTKLSLPFDNIALDYGHIHSSHWPPLSGRLTA